MLTRRHLVLVLIAALSFFSPLRGASRALIVVGTTGSSSIADELKHSAQTIREALVLRGFSPDAVEILAAEPAARRINRDDVLQRLKSAQNLTATDEYWLVLLGFSAPTGDGSPAFQVAGPRLDVDTLKTALDAIPARQYVFIGTSDAGGFVPALLKAHRDVLAATKEEGEIDLPRYPDGWAEALKANPHAEWKQVAAIAADLTAKFYSENNLAPGEHSRLGDPATGKVLEPPFGVDTTAPAALPPPRDDGSMTLIDPNEIKVDIHKPNSEWETQPATAETKKLIAEARAAPNPDGFSAVMLEQRIGYRIGDDTTAENTVLRRVYIEREDGVERWANFILPQDPPAVTTKLIAARIIQPDGASVAFNPDKTPEATDTTSGLCGALTAVFIPGAHAGCLIEIAYRTNRLLDVGDPEYSESLEVQQDIPVLSTQLELQIPAAGHIHFKLRNLDAKPTESDGSGMRTLAWKLDNLPGYEGLPFDPPKSEMLGTLDISSLDSWNEFANWYLRLAQGSDKQDDSVRAKAKELAATATSRVDKIRKAFEFVSSLRYVAIEFGINGIRPRTPAAVLQNRYGDCKDKANLLIALLADMGIDARFCLLNRGSSTDTSFPGWQFNHAIAFVPKAPGEAQPDDLFLDTTDSTAPFPTLSPGDIGRSALVFSGQTAEFITVASAREEGTTYDERWQLRQGPDGHWAGTLQTTWGGLAEYDLRQAVRGLTPRQRDFALQNFLARQLPDADFSQLDLTAADDLAKPLQLKAAVQLGAPAYPLSAFDSTEYFAAATRNRPLLLNNGQKLNLVQTIDVIYQQNAPVDPPAPFHAEAAGIRVSAEWQKVDDHTYRRTAKLDVEQPLVAAADYASVRDLLRQWTRYLSH